MNNLISIIMSLVLYNPLEAGVLLLASWFFKPRNIHRPHFNIKEFIHKCYIIGLLNYIIQIPEQFLENSLFYFFYLFAVVFFGMSLTLKIFGYKNIWACCMSIMLLYNFSLTLIVDIGKMPTIISEIVSNNAQQLLNNLIIRIVQILIIFILLGGTQMFKKALKKMAQKNIGKMVASTTRGYGETKLSAKLAKEVKESK